jgi:hypothetical protein
VVWWRRYGVVWRVLGEKERCTAACWCCGCTAREKMKEEASAEFPTPARPAVLRHSTVENDLDSSPCVNLTSNSTQCYGNETIRLEFGYSRVPDYAIESDAMSDCPSKKPTYSISNMQLPGHSLQQPPRASVEDV